MATNSEISKTIDEIINNPNIFNDDDLDSDNYYDDNDPANANNNNNDSNVQTTAKPNPNDIKQIVDDKIADKSFLQKIMFNSSLLLVYAWSHIVYIFSCVWDAVMPERAKMNIDFNTLYYNMNLNSAAYRENLVASGVNCARIVKIFDNAAKPGPIMFLYVTSIDISRSKKNIIKDHKQPTEQKDENIKDINEVPQPIKFTKEDFGAFAEYLKPLEEK